MDKVTIRAFKPIAEADLDLAPINVLVGGNNSGKSCILQGIHFGITLSQARQIAGTEQFPPERLRYCPTDDFLDLRTGRRLTEGTSVEFIYTRKSAEGTDDVAQIALQRGRNGVVKAQISGSVLLSELSDPRGFFSIYVPGLAGISIREEYRSELVVSNGIARGDANLYLRNVLLRIQNDQERRARFHEYLQSIFPYVAVQTKFNGANDLWIRTHAISEHGEERALDMFGTGLLQAVQLIAYVANYEPKLLLLDEPDAHLHPSNQRLLAETLRVIAENTSTKIILATHSRHLLDALSDKQSCRLFWVKEGRAEPQDNWADIAMLMDLGALDKGERFLSAQYKFLVLTEDTNTECLKLFLDANGVNPQDILVFSYKSSSKFDSAALIAGFINQIRPGVITIIHRDRDFMTDDEVELLKSRYNLAALPNLRLFVASPADIESYFTSPEHVSRVSGLSLQDAKALVDSVVADNSNAFVLAFREKREEVKRLLYKSGDASCPSTESLLHRSSITRGQCVGKRLLKLLRTAMQEQGRNGGVLMQQSSALIDTDFQSLVSTSASVG